MLYQARQHHRHQRGCRFRDGILFFHQYDRSSQDALTRSADVEFILGSRRISVTWRHPRQVYRDKIDDVVYAAVEHLYSEKHSLLNDTSNKIYKKVGKSRKKVLWYMAGESGNTEWASAFNKEEERLRREADFTIHPSIQVRVYDWCRMVDIVAPMKVRNINGLKKLAELVRRLLKWETTLDAEFPGYVYDRKQWISESGGIR